MAAAAPHPPQPGAGGRTLARACFAACPAAWNRPKRGRHPSLKPGMSSRAAKVAEAVRRRARGEQGRLAIGLTSSAPLHPFCPHRPAHLPRRPPRCPAGAGGSRARLSSSSPLHGRLDAAFVRSPVETIPGRRDPLLMIGAGRTARQALVADPAPLAVGDSDRTALGLLPAGPGRMTIVAAACRGGVYAGQCGRGAGSPRPSASLPPPGYLHRPRVDGHRMPDISFRPLTGCPGAVRPLAPGPAAHRHQRTAGAFRQPPATLLGRRRTSRAAG